MLDLNFTGYVKVLFDSIFGLLSTIRLFAMGVVGVLNTSLYDLLKVIDLSYGDSFTDLLDYFFNLKDITLLGFVFSGLVTFYIAFLFIKFIIGIINSAK